jgi:hypothetical protein
MKNIFINKIKPNFFNICFFVAIPCHIEFCVKFRSDKLKFTKDLETKLEKDRVKNCLNIQKSKRLNT